jgi:SAM-dependent methyltransferase
VAINKHAVERAWDVANPKAIHPTRNISEAAYWASGDHQALTLADELPADGRILDYGCGDGRVLKPLRSLGVDVAGADTSIAMLMRLGDDVPSQLVDGPIEGKFDAVYALAVLIHHDYQSQNEIVAAIAACLVDDGIAILDWPVGTPYERQRWIEVTIRNKADRNAFAASVGLYYVRDIGLGAIFVKGDNA